MRRSLGASYQLGADVIDTRLARPRDDLSALRIVKPSPGHRVLEAEVVDERGRVEQLDIDVRAVERRQRAAERPCPVGVADRLRPLLVALAIRPL